jgi:hypothetical protein
LQALEPHAGRIVILNQPPILPATASRAAIRQGAIPPFYEDADAHHLRLATNEIVNRSAGSKVTVIDVASHFEGAGGAVRFLDDQGRQLYYDRWHLSGFGGDLVKPLLARELFPIKTGNMD